MLQSMRDFHAREEKSHDRIYLKRKYTERELFRDKKGRGLTVCLPGNRKVKGLLALRFPELL